MKVKMGRVTDVTSSTKKEAKMSYPKMNYQVPSWAKIRKGWTYVGWIAKDPAIGPFEELVERAGRSDHGKLREVDIIPRGPLAG